MLKKILFISIILILPAIASLFFLNKIPPSLIQTNTLDQQSPLQEFHQEVLALNNPQIDNTALNSFIAYLKEGIPNISKEERQFLDRIIAERTRELQQNPQKVVTMVKLFISSIKGFANDLYLDQIQFNENQIKQKVIKNYHTPQSEIMPNNTGRITDVSVILVVDGDRGASETDLFNAIIMLLDAKADQPDFHIKAVYKDNGIKDKFLGYLNTKDRAHLQEKIVFLEAPETQDIFDPTIWFRDGAVRTHAGIIEAHKFYSAVLAMGYDNLIPYEGGEIKQSELMFQGGNIRATDSHVFIGSDDVYFTAIKLKEGQLPPEFNNRIYPDLIDDGRLNQDDIARAIQAFEAEFAKKVIVIGLEKDEKGRYKVPKIKQDTFHIDMMMTAISDQEILVAEMENKPYFDQVTQQLEEEGFTVHRLPYYEYEVDVKNPMITYNNALIEIYDDQKKVYLPQYYNRNSQGKREDGYYIQTSDGELSLINLAELNAQAREIYENLGFEVIPIDLSKNLIDRQGSLNCITFEGRAD